MFQPPLESKNAQLMAFVRYEVKADLEKKCLFCITLATTAIDADVLNVADNFQQKEVISKENCVSLCTDSAPGDV